MSEPGTGYRVCALNLPGFGGSDEPPCAWSVDDYADFTLDFLAELDIRSAVLIGHEKLQNILCPIWNGVVL